MADSHYHERLWAGTPEGLEPSDFELRRRFLIAHVGVGDRVLDVGCGEGAFTAELARAGAHPIGIEVTDEPLRRARALHPELELRAVRAHGPWELQDASFDVVWAGEVIEHVLDTSAWLSEVRRVLRSGGKLLASTPDHGPLTLLGLALSPRAFAKSFVRSSRKLREKQRSASPSFSRNR